MSPVKLEYSMYFRDNVASKRIRMSRGVHHPKFIIVFTKLGLHFAVCTGNLTISKGSVNATWFQFFPKKASDGDEFGKILEDFLFQLSEQQSPITSMSLMHWIKRHTGITSSLSKSFDFSQSEVLFRI